MKILFVCHGNICRSPMAEFVMKDLVEKSNLNKQVYIFSAATHNDEIGSNPHSQTIKILKENNVKIYEHRAIKICDEDFDKFDLILCMDDENMEVLKRIYSAKLRVEFNKFDKDFSMSQDDFIAQKSKEKIKFLLEFADENLNKSPKHRELIIDDPYYTHNFKQCFYDINRSCQGLLKWLKNQI
ncbi:MAG: low molecular weight phosphotyrosine protein phosphatase [Campylobacter sp.]|nr:low molecular weight phosphotyrosine protein phosphatase [Campylobacter sp.]